MIRLAMSQTRVIVELNEELAVSLETAARRSRMSVQDFATKAVARAVADVQQWAEEETAYAEYEKSGEAIPLAAVEEWVRSWGTSNELPPPVPCKLSS